jgi:succinate dehydrogenase flavoprotein subunit
VGPQKNGVYLDFKDAIQRVGKATIEERYGNLFEMYDKITGENPYVVPMRIYPAPHYTMGGLWVDYDLMTNVTGLYALGEANFSDHGANRLGASALMQGLADGYFVIPYTIGNYLSGHLGQALTTETDAFRATEADVQSRIQRLLSIKGKRTADSFHRELGKIVWDYCGITRTAGGLKKALELIPALREEFWSNLLLLGGSNQLNQELEKANRVGDYFELAELMCIDALERDESCGSHLREEHQDQFGEALRDDDHFSYVSSWQWNGVGKAPSLNKEPLQFEFVKPTQRSYK